MKLPSNIKLRKTPYSNYLQCWAEESIEMCCWQDLPRDTLCKCVVCGERERRLKEGKSRDRRDEICWVLEKYVLAMCEKVITGISSDLLSHGALTSSSWWTFPLQCDTGKANSTIIFLPTPLPSVFFNCKNGITIYPVNDDSNMGNSLDFFSYLIIKSWATKGMALK